MTLTGCLKEGQGKAGNNVPKTACGRTGFTRDSEKTALTKCYKEQKAVQSHNRPRSEWTGHKEEEEEEEKYYYIIVFFFSGDHQDYNFSPSVLPLGNSFRSQYQAPTCSHSFV